MMEPLQKFVNPGIKFVFTDIDDTLTENGKLGADSYSALWALKKNGLKIIPVTGRPAGWCEMIARFWPVDGVVGENGGLYFRYTKNNMIRHFMVSEAKRNANRLKLDKIVAPQILKEVKGSAIASDQFCRMLDLAVDYAEDVKPLAKLKVQKIVKIFESHGAVAKVSSIHVNGWFGKYDKLTMCKQLLKNEFNTDIDQNKKICIFVGDSPNDEPMFQYFPLAFAVANISNFIDEIKNKPAFVASKTGGKGFAEIAEKLLTNS